MKSEVFFFAGLVLTPFHWFRSFSFRTLFLSSAPQALCFSVATTLSFVYGNIWNVTGLETNFQFKDVLLSVVTEWSVPAMAVYRVSWSLASKDLYVVFSCIKIMNCTNKLLRFSLLQTPVQAKRNPLFPSYDQILSSFLYFLISAGVCRYFLCNQWNGSHFPVWILWFAIHHEVFIETVLRLFRSDVT